jgi:hypothetical protein
MGEAATVIAVATTTVTVRTVTEAEPGEGRTVSATARNVRAHFSAVSGGESTRPGGGQSTLSGTALLDPCTVAHTDQLVDENTGEVWEVLSARLHRGVGLDHVRCEVERIEGYAP